MRLNLFLLSLTILFTLIAVASARWGKSKGQCNGHIVEKGETLGKIAKSYNVPLNSVKDCNKKCVPNPDKIFPGEFIWIPGKSSCEPCNK